jgi:hypothetical protein
MLRQALGGIFGKRRRWRMFLPALLAAIAVGAPSVVQALELPHCADCELGTGIGTTYHFWSTTNGLVIPLTFVWKDGSNEVGLFRMATEQRMMNSRLAPGHRMTEPYWGLTVTHRWWLLTRPSWRVFFGFGGAYKPVNDELSSTHLNFAETLGVRVPLQSDGATLEIAMRHWSNGGIRMPNHGQDFATLGVTWPIRRHGTAQLSDSAPSTRAAGRQFPSL